MFQWMAPYTCTQGQHWLDSVSFNEGKQDPELRYLRGGGGGAGMNMTKLYTCLKGKRLKVSEESILECGLIPWGLLSRHLLSIAWLVFPTWTCHLSQPAQLTLHSLDGTLDSWLGLVGTKGTGWRHGSGWGYSRLFSLDSSGFCTLPQRLLPVNKYITTWLVVMAAGLCIWVM